jgi:hypothetical protein
LLKSNEVGVELVGALPLKGIDGKTKLYRVSELHIQPQDILNPFIWRGGITRAEDFFNRDNEQRMLRAYLRGRQNCQIVGPRRIGKTSLLRQVERAASEWERNTTIAYLDLQDARCFTVDGWLKLVARQCHWSAPIVTLADFADCVENTISDGIHLILCLDEFDELAARRGEFTRDFFLTLRSCAQGGLSIITASQRTLSDLTDRGDPTSPFYNTFSLLRLGRFDTSDAEDFVNLYRPGVPAFTTDERTAILDFAKGHPLALQVACFHVLEAKHDDNNLAAAMQKAADDMKAHQPSLW